MRVLAPLQTDAFFAARSGHAVIPGNRVLELRKESVVLEKEFEGSTEVPFFVSAAIRPYTRRLSPVACWHGLEDLRLIHMSN